MQKHLTPDVVRFEDIPDGKGFIYDGRLYVKERTQTPQLGNATELPAAKTFQKQG